MTVGAHQRLCVDTPRLSATSAAPTRRPTALVRRPHCHSRHAHPSEKTPPSSAHGASWKARKRLRRGDFPQAAEGTRTLDLLHGKQSTMTKFGHVLPANAAVPGIDPCKGVVGFVAFCRGCVNQSSTASATLDCPCLADGLTNVSGSPQALRRRRGPGECVATPLHGVCCVKGRRVRAVVRRGARGELVAVRCRGRRPATG
jgi:hypothetical protein